MLTVANAARGQITMPQDAFTLQFVARELNSLLTGGKISKINQPKKDGLSLLIYTKQGTVKLDIDLSAKHCRVSLGEESESLNPQIAPNFCMLLRKHLQNAEVTSVGQTGFERVLFIDFKCFSEFEVTDMRLYLEIMGKYSNALLTKNGIIVGALKIASLENNAKRVTLSGAKYLLPEKQDKADPTNLQELKAAFGNKCGEAAKFVSESVAGIAYVTAQDIVNIYGEEVTADDVHAFVTKPDFCPCVTYANGEPADFKAVYNEGAKKHENILAAQAAFYSHEVKKKTFADKRRKISSALSAAVKKYEKRLAGIYSKLADCERADEIKLKGELITANIYAVERGSDRFEAVNYYDPDGGKIVIELDKTLTPSQNAQKYFKKYTKMKRTVQVLEGQKRENEDGLYYLKSIEANINSSEDICDLIETEDELIALKLMPAPPKIKGAKKANDNNPYRTYNFDGFEILCGRNNAQNDRLTKSLNQNDMWLHTKSYHSSHVAVISGGREITEGAIKFAAEVCAYYSDARGKDKAPVDYTLKKYVRKPNGANLGFVVYTDFNTILVAPKRHENN